MTAAEAGGAGGDARSAAPAARMAAIRARLESEQRVRRMRESDPPQETHSARVIFQGQALLNFGGNDYLGLTHEPRVSAAGVGAISRFGTGATGSRLLTGNKTVHTDLERALAGLKSTPRALVFPSGYQAAVTLLSTFAALYETPPPMLLDKLAHASLLDGARLSGGRVQRFKHNDVADLEKYLQRNAPARCVVAVESIYSMDGDAAPLAAIHAVCKRHGAILIIDDAHATGVLGAGGSGLTQAFAGDENVAILGTLSKALASQGGFIAGHDWAIEMLIQLGRGFLFSTGLNPAAAAAALAAVEQLPGLDRDRRQIAQHRERMLSVLPARRTTLSPGYPPAAAIVPVLVGEDGRALELSDCLRAEGLYVPAVRPPTVPPGTARLRISLSAVHTADDLTRLLEGLSRHGLTRE